MIDQQRIFMIERAPRRLLVTGAAGMLGRDLVETASASGFTVFAADRDTLNISDLNACVEAVAGFDAVLNAAASTRVDDAEEHESDAYLVNAAGAANLARAARAAGAVLVQYSTDYVFSGQSPSPWPESAPLEPINAYGRTKAAGEQLAREAHPEGTIILRTAWLYATHGSNFVRTMTRLYRERGTLTVVDDQYGQPTWTRDLAEQTARLLATGTRSGIFHGTNSGSTTWFGFARAIVENLGGDPADVHPTTSDAFPRPAQRPAYSVLGHDAWRTVGLEPMRPWREALDEAMAEGVTA